MRKILWPVAGIAGLAVIAGGLLLYRATPVPPASPGVVSAPLPLRDAAPALVGVAEAPAGATAAAPPQSPAPTPPEQDNRLADNAAPAAVATDAAPAPAAPSSAAPGPSGSDLPVVQVAPRVVHAVPEKEPGPPAPVTVTDKAGRVMTRLMPRPMPAPAPAPTSVAAAATPPRPLNNAPPSVGSTLISVSGQSVKLFGVRPTDPTDVCLAKDGHARPCTDVARDTMAARLASFAGVHCRAPGGQRSDAGSICLDGAGVDLAGFLVGEGLALADPGESHDYVGAEGVARANKRGLWRYR